MIEAVYTSETSMYFETTQHFIPEECHPHNHCCENLKSHILELSCTKETLNRFLCLLFVCRHIGAVLLSSGIAAYTATKYKTEMAKAWIDTSNFMAAPITDVKTLSQNPNDMKTKIELLIMRIQVRPDLDLFILFHNLHMVSYLAFVSTLRKPNIAPKWLGLLLHIQEVLGSNLGSETGYSN
jgi:hypothetical protein